MTLLGSVRITIVRELVFTARSTRNQLSGRRGNDRQKE